MSSNYSSSMKVTKKYHPDVPYDANENDINKSPSKNNSFNVYLNSSREPENGTRFRFDKSATNGYTSRDQPRETSPRADPTRSHSIGRNNIKQYDDFKEEYDPEYRKDDNIFWKDPEKEAKLKKDFYLNHKKVSEDEYKRYLDKENITGKSLLRRPSADDEIRDNARKYYEQNKSKKSSKSVSEIFSKRAQSVEPTTSSNKSNEKKAVERQNSYDMSAKNSKDIKYKPSILKDTGDYAPVYKNRHTSYRIKEENNRATSPKIDNSNKPEVYFSDTYRKPTTERRSAEKNTTKYDEGYELPSYYKGVTTSDKNISDHRDNKSSIKISKTFDNSAKYRDPSVSPTRDTYIRSPVSTLSKKKAFFGDDFRPNEEVFHSDSSRISSPEIKNHVRDVSPSYGKKSSVYISDSSHKFSTVPQHLDSRSTSRSIRKSVLDSGHSDSLSNGLAYADEEEDHIKDSRNADLMKLYHSKGREYENDHSAPSRISWTYNKKGVLINDIVDGQPCDNCPEVCSGFHQHPWRKTCQSCKCPRESHAVYQEEWADVRARLGLVVTPGQWAPPGLSPAKADAFMRAAGGGYPEERTRRLAHQLPRQDLAAAHCRHLEPKHKSSFEDFIAARNEIALDIGFAKENHGGAIECPTCHLSVKSGDLGVVATRLGDDTMFHPACFTCTTCGDILADLAYCALDDRPYCERHYAELLKPRCSACDELIFSGEYTKAMNKDWHSGHFCCWQCDESLTGQRYVLRDDHPYCIKCYESVFANGCEECNKIIGIDSKDLSYKDKHWHEACFLCAKCRVSLVDKQFGSKVDKIYCGNCYDAQFASRCDGCGEVFRAGTKKMEYKTRQWHEKCFCCVVCKTPIGTKSFIPREQEIYCAGCYEEKFATRCVKCNKIITQGGVTYKNEPWHRECFTCTNCSTSLAGQRFTSRDDKPYCAECFGELFAKRCTSCVKPITGIGGTRFISFEDRHWHNDCFICAQCKTSLVGRGFITDAQDIICPECAKQKLM